MTTPKGGKRLLVAYDCVELSEMRVLCFDNRRHLLPFAAVHPEEKFTEFVLLLDGNRLQVFLGLRLQADKGADAVVVEGPCRDEKMRNGFANGPRD